MNSEQMEHKHNPSPMHIYCLSSNCTIQGLNGQTSHPNISSTLYSSENPIPWPQELPHSHETRATKSETPTKSQQAWPVAWHRDKTLRLPPPFSIPEAERFCDLLRVTPHVTHRAPHTHPQPAVHQSNLRVISIRWGAKVPKDLNLSLLTYNSLLESGHFS